jgi:hypothetical protein
MAKSTFSKKDNLLKDYDLVVKSLKKKNNLSSKQLIAIDWQSGENFQLFSLYNDVHSGVTSTESCLTYNQSNA